MKQNFFVLLAAIVGTYVVVAQDSTNSEGKAGASTEIDALGIPYKAALQAVSEESGKWHAALQTWYISGLNKLFAERKTAGDLDGAVAVKAETDRIATGAETFEGSSRACRIHCANNGHYTMRNSSGLPMKLRHEQPRLNASTSLILRLCRYA